MFQIRFIRTDPASIPKREHELVRATDYYNSPQDMAQNGNPLLVEGASFNDARDAYPIYHGAIAGITITYLWLCS